MARRLLLLIPMICAATAVGCPVPPPLDVDNPDAGASSPPVILESRPEEFAFPGPIVVLRGDTRSFDLTLSDNDVNDTSFVRLFVDYNVFRDDDGNLLPTNFSSDCSGNAGEAGRIASCPAIALCDGIAAGDASVHALEAVVADRAFLSLDDPDAIGQPLFRAVEPGGSPPTVRGWLMTCGDVP